MKFKIIAIAIIVVVALGFIFKDDLKRTFFKPTPSTVPQAQHSEQGNQNELKDIETIKSGLKIPWEIVLLPDNRLLVTERAGNIKVFSLDDPAKEVSISIQGIAAAGEGGLLGAALHPDFESNKQIYLYYTTRSEGALVNRVERFKLENDKLAEGKIIVNNIPGNSNHDGGRIAFGPDGYLYITTGDAQNEDSAQDKSSLAGKILRVDSEGRAALDNPFNNLVFSYGHRNPQGIIWDDQKRLWATEHGPSGTQTGNDELNLIERGANYGWPVIKGTQQRAGMKTPVLESGSSETWAPAGIAYANNSLFFGGLRGQTLYEAKLGGDKPVLSAHFRNEFGRVRAIVAAEYKGEKVLYLTTSNRDGRGNPIADDDRIIRVRIESLK
jgi:glucose/arabinose dehydrogenase